MDNPKPFTQQLLEQATLYRQQAQDLRPSNPAEAERLEQLATQLTTQAITSDAANEAARVKAHLDKWVGDHKAIADWHNENTKSLISLSQTAIRLQVTINAGSAVALLAFLGNAINKNAGTVASLFAAPLVIFAAGVAVAALIAVASYVTQFLYGKESERAQWWARVVHSVTFATGFISLGLFIAGCFQTYDGMRLMAKSAINATMQSSANQLSTAPAAVNVTCEVPPMAEPPKRVPGPTHANDNAPRPFKTPPAKAQIPVPASPPPPPAKK